MSVSGADLPLPVLQPVPAGRGAGSGRVPLHAVQLLHAPFRVCAPQVPRPVHLPRLYRVPLRQQPAIPGASFLSAAHGACRLLTVLTVLTQSLWLSATHLRASRDGTKSAALARASHERYRTEDVTFCSASAAGAAVRALHALALLRAVHTVQLHLPPVLQVPRRHGRLLPGAPPPTTACLITNTWICQVVAAAPCAPSPSATWPLPGTSRRTRQRHPALFPAHQCACCRTSTLMPSLLTQAGHKHLHTS